jgi:DME family drug/metabolite transporter
MIGELSALGAAICWAVSAILYKEALLKTKPVSANILRLACTSLILIAFLAIVGKFGVLLNLPTYAVVLASVSGIIGLGLGDTLYMVSLRMIGVARAVPVTCTYPLFSLLWAFSFQKETVTSQVVLGTIAIVAGVWLVSQGGETNGTETQKKTLAKGVAAALATAVMWSVSITMINMAVTMPETSSLDQAFAINAIRVTAIAVSLTASVPIIDRGLNFLKMDRKTLAVLIAGGIVALALGWFFLAFSFLKIPESQAVPISSTTPLFSTLAGIILLHEKVTAKNAIGSTLIVAGIFLVFTV